MKFITMKSLGIIVALTLTAFACGDSNTGSGGPTFGGATDGGSSKNRDGGGTNDGGTGASFDSGAGGGDTTGGETCEVESSPSNYCYCDDSTVHSSLAQCPSGYSCCVAFDSHSCSCTNDDEAKCADYVATEPTWTRVSSCP